MLEFSRWYDARLPNTLTVRIDFVCKLHNRPRGVGGGVNGFGEVRV